MSPDEANLAVLRARPLRLGRSLLYYGTRSSTRQSRFYFRADRASALDRQNLRKISTFFHVKLHYSMFLRPFVLWSTIAPNRVNMRVCQVVHLTSVASIAF